MTDRTADSAKDILKVIEYFITSDIPLTPSERLEAIGATIRDWRWETHTGQAMALIHDHVETSDAD